MPGIVGLITDMPVERARQELASMVQSVVHDPSCETGTWTDESLGVYVGWVERTNSFSSGMPLRNEREDVTLVVSGEEYPEPGLASRLSASGHSLDAKPASYLVHLYEDNPGFLQTLNGLFHGLVADRTRQTATLFNDRYGMHRLYYHQGDKAFYFAAEAKAILAVRPELRTVDPRGLGEFVACGCVLENRTLFSGIFVLPGAAAWTFRNGSLEHKGAYFTPSQWEEQPRLSPEAYYHELRDVFSRNLPRYFNGHEPVGLALTGGLDTRLIMALRQAERNSLPCYTFGSMFRETQDVAVARRVARVCEQPYQVIVTGSDFLSRFSQYAERTVYLTDGCLDVGRAPDLYVSEQARTIAPVKVVGTYGSEMLTVVPAFKPVELSGGFLAPGLSDSVRQAGATYAAIRKGHPVTFAAFRQSPWWHHGILALERSQLTVRSPYLDSDFMRTVYRAPASPAAPTDVRQRLIADGNPALGRLPTDRGLGGDSGQLSSTMSRGLLHFALKAEYAYDYGMPQWLARIDHRLSRLHLERLFLGRHRMFHFRVWYRDALAAYVREMLLDDRTLSRPYFERHAVETVVRGHLRGDRNYTREIHKMLTIELVHRLFVDAR